MAQGKTGKTSPKSRKTAKRNKKMIKKAAVKFTKALKKG